MRRTSKQQGFDAIGALPVLQDDFAILARGLWEDGTVNASAVFISRLVLDILDVCGGPAQPRFVRELREEGRMAENSMEFVRDSAGALDTREVRWLTKDVQLIMEIYQLVSIHIPDFSFRELKKIYLTHFQSTQAEGGLSGPLEDMPPEVQAAVRQHLISKGEDPDDGSTEEHKRNARNLNPKLIRPSFQGDFLQSHNAMFCGSYSLQLALKMEDAGIALANHHLSIFATAHLYNALHQMGITTIRWPDMDRIIDLHTGALFANDVPVTPSDLYRRMAYRTAYKGSSRSFDKKQPWKFRTGAASASLKQLLDSTDSVEHALLNLEAQIEDHATSQTISWSKKNNVSGRRRQLKPAQVMARFQEYLPVVLKDMQLNYVTLTKTCNGLIKAIRTALQDELGMNMPSMQTPGDSNDHSVIYVVLKVLEENQKSAAVHERKKDKSPFRGSVEVKTACRVFEEFFNFHIARMLTAA